MRFANISRLVALLSAVSRAAVSVGAGGIGAVGGWQPGPGAILDNTYDGFIDAPRPGATVPGSGRSPSPAGSSTSQAQGWAGADDIEVWLGTMDGGGHMLAKANIAQSRPDVAAATGNPYWAASGFGASVHGSSVPGGNQTLNVYAHTGGKGWWFKRSSVVGGGAAAAAAPAPARSACASRARRAVARWCASRRRSATPTENQNVSTRSTFTINGTVSDPTHIDRIEVWINGERDSGTPAGHDDARPATARGRSRSTRRSSPSTHTNLYVYAHNSATRLETEIGRRHQHRRQVASLAERCIEGRPAAARVERRTPSRVRHPSCCTGEANVG